MPMTTASYTLKNAEHHMEPVVSRDGTVSFAGLEQMSADEVYAYCVDIDRNRRYSDLKPLMKYGRDNSFNARLEWTRALERGATIRLDWSIRKGYRIATFTAE